MPRSLFMYDTEYRWISVDTPDTTSAMNTDSGSTRIDSFASTPELTS